MVWEGFGCFVAVGQRLARVQIPAYFQIPTGKIPPQIDTKWHGDNARQSFSNKIPPSRPHRVALGMDCCNHPTHQLDPTLPTSASSPILGTLILQILGTLTLQVNPTVEMCRIGTKKSTGSNYDAIGRNSGCQITPISALIELCHHLAGGPSPCPSISTYSFSASLWIWKV